MIALVLAQIAARWGQAVTIFVLSLAAGVAAASGPAYALAIEQAVIANETASADAAELTAGIPVFQRQWTGAPGADGANERADARDELAGFVPVDTVQIQVGEGKGDSGEPMLRVHRMVSRDGFCGHVVFVTGRCPVGTREAALPRRFAEAEEMTPGQEVVLTPVVPDVGGTWQPDGLSFTLTVVGIFDARDETDPYWFPMDPLGVYGQAPAIFVPRSAIWTVGHNQELLSIDAVMPAELLTPQRIPELREQLNEVSGRLAGTQLAPSGVGSGLPRLLDRIDEQTAQARALLPIAAVPLLMLCWFVIYLAVGNGLVARRQEVGMVALRGVKPWTRGFVVAGECVLPVLVGVPVGLLLAPVLVTAIGPASGGVPLNGDQLLAAAGAAAGALVAVLLAVRRELSAPVSELLRRVPPRRRIAAAAVETVLLAVAALLVADLWMLGGELVGVSVVAPAAIMLAVALVVARVVRVLVDALGRSSLRAGRLGPALAALHLARRPGVKPLLATLGVVLAMFGFAVAAAETATRARVADAELTLGADRVLEIGTTSRGALLEAVRAADPEGRYAMAVVAVPPYPGDPETLAVDSARLAAVARWADGSDAAAAARIAEWLRPAAPEPVVVTDGELVAELTPDLRGTAGVAVLALRLIPTGGDLPVEVEFGPVTSERREYTATVSGCSEGCRLAAAVLKLAPGVDPGYLDRMGVVLSSLRQDGADVGPPDWLADVSRWRNPEQGLTLDQPRAAVVDHGLALYKGGPEPGVEYEMYFVDAPYPLPVFATGALARGNLLVGIDGSTIRVTPQHGDVRLPGVGQPGALVDLEYAERLAAAPGLTETLRVWLAEDAPPEVVERLRGQGLVITGERNADTLRAELEQAGTAQALRYHLLAAGMAVVVGFAALILVSMVDRRTWAPALNRLRSQGLSGRTATAAALWSYGGVVIAGALAGVPAVLVAWLVTGERIPFGVDPALLPAWPRWTQVAVAGAAVVAALIMAAAGLAWWQRGVAADRR